MSKNKMRDIYFDVLEVIAEKNFCPKVNLCDKYERSDSEICIECISEYIMSSGKFGKKTMNEILGE